MPASLKRMVSVVADGEGVNPGGSVDVRACATTPCTRIGPEVDATTVLVTFRRATSTRSSGCRPERTANPQLLGRCTRISDLPSQIGAISVACTPPGRKRRLLSAKRSSHSKRSCGVARVARSLGVVTAVITAASRSNRRGVVEAVRQLAEVGFTDLAMTTKDG